MKRTGKKMLIPVLLLLVLSLVAGWFLRKKAPVYSASVQNVPAYSGKPYIAINDNQPEFTDDDLTTKAYEYYSPLDHLGRCGYTMASVGRELMPTQERESISHIKPTGWVQAQYDFVDGKSLYNRCHLIGFQLAGENDNERNLITGTRYMNVQGMLPFENMVADYVKETGNHVLYRVTPIYDGENPVARGVQMEALSVEDKGDGICFHVYVYNVQPGVIIDYETGYSWLDDHQQNTENEKTTSARNATYILNKNSKKFHDQDCEQAKSIKESNREIYTGDRQDLIDKGYTSSGCCKP